MTINIAFSGTNDGGVYSHDPSYATAQNTPAAGNVLVTNNPFVTYGQAFNGAYPGEYTIDEAFLQFAYTLPTGELCNSAYFQFVGYDVASPGIYRDMRIYQYDWGTTLEAADWRANSDPAFDGGNQIAKMQNAQALSSGMIGRAGSYFVANSLLGSSGSLRVVLVTDRKWLGATPTGDERNHVYSADQSGTTYDPRLVYMTRPASSLNGVLGASVQLSNGTRVYMEIADNLASPYASLIHHDGTTATVIATGLQSSLLDIYHGPAWGLQEVSLTRDASDNLYLVRGSVDQFIAEAYVKGAGYSWTRKAALNGTLPFYDAGSAVVMQTVCAWHASGGTAGTVVMAAARNPGSHERNTSSFALLNCDALLAGAGTLTRGYNLGKYLLTEPATSDLITYQNETGTGMDVAAAPGSTTGGFIASYNSTNGVSFTRYTLNTAGDGFASLAMDTTTDPISKDANSKLRVLPINSTTVATVYGDRIVVRQNTSGTTFTTINSVSLAGQGIGTFPTAAALRSTAAWDAVYDAGSGKIWFYYFSAADGRRLMRTAFNVNTGLATKEEIQVSAAVGVAGAVNVALRAPRGVLSGPTLRLAVASNSTGLKTTVYVTDTLNAPPNAPTLTPKTNFDATAAGVFAWAFNDPNPGDTQSAYQIDINTSAGVDVYDSGKVTSTAQSHTLTAATLTNGNAYQWRVTTWDAGGLQGPYSTYGTFSTAAGGTVTITDPAADNPAGVITSNYVVGWSVAGTTQASYRVQAVRTDTNATLLDTGFVAGTATSYNVTGLLSDVPYRISVTVQNASAVTSATGTRLITASYAKPETPTLTAAPSNDDGYVLVVVTNPAPQGSRPQVSTNQILRRKAGTTDTYTVIGAAPVNGSYRDYTAASGITYQYIARGTA